MIQIVIVEDDPDTQFLLKSVFHKSGFRTICYDNGKDFLAEFEVLSPDLMLLDVKIPQMSGIDILQKIAHRKQAPIIMMTSCANPVDAEKTITMGATAYISKPTDYNELIKMVKDILDYSEEEKHEKTYNFYNFLFYHFARNLRSKLCLPI